MRWERHLLEKQFKRWLEPRREDQADLSERYGRVENGRSNHPFTKSTGRKGASNVQDDEVAGSE